MCMSLRSRAASGQGNVGIYLPCVPEQLLDKEMLGFIYLAFQNSFWTRKCWDLFTLRSRTASGQGNVGIYLPCIPKQLLDKVMLVIPPCVLELPLDKVVLITQISISDRLGCDSTRVPTRCLPPKGKIVTGPFHQSFYQQ